MNAVPACSRLITTHDAELPLVAAHVACVASDGVATVTLRQRFRNPTADPAEVTWLLPVPPRAAVGAFAFTLDGARCVGVIRPREQAREDYARALMEGRAAGLLEHTRDGLFTQRLGSVPPGAEVEVEVELDQALDWEGAGWTWRFPTVVAPRYVDHLTEGADEVAVDVIDGPKPGRLSLGVRVLDALTGPVDCPTHPLSGAAGDLRLAGPKARLDRDVVVRWPVAAAAPGVRLVVGDAGGQLVGRLVVTPPAAAGAVVPRDLVLLLDVSGSMSGRPMDQLRAVATTLVADLGDADTVELVAFGGDVRRYAREPVAVDPTRRADLTRWIQALSANGGTPMDEGIVAALATRRASAQRQVVLLTDGHIGFEDRVIDLIRRHLPLGTRLHAVGVGDSVNRGLLTRAARLGGGHELVLGLYDAPARALDHLRGALTAPVLVDLRLTGEALVAPASLRGLDVFAGAPAVTHALLRQGTLVVTGRGPEGPWSRTLAVGAPTTPGGAALGRLYAREAVGWRELDPATPARDADVEALGLRWGIATTRTTWVAVSDAVTVDPNAPSRRVVVPHEAPAGLSIDALGLRAPATFAYPASAPPPGLSPTSAPPPQTAAPRARAAAPAPTGGGWAARAADLARRVARMGPPADDTRREAPLEPDPAPPLRLVAAEVVDGALVLTFEVSVASAWSPPAQVLVDGLPAAVRLARSSRPGPVAAGARVRLVVDHAAWPTTVTLDGRPFSVPSIPR